MVTSPSTLVPRDMLDRFLESAATLSTPTLGGQGEVTAWFAERAARGNYTTEAIAFAELDGWSFDPDTGDLGHRSGGFFTIRGLDVHDPAGVVPAWTQPIIHQPEVGVLGILVKEIDGVLCLLMQAKMEPGNVNVIQLSPTVQATRSNFLRLHGGAPTKYLEHFTEPGRGTVLVDVLHSEQGGRFFRKRNRNIIVEITEDVPLHEGFRWFTLGQVHELLRQDNMVNMDSRTVLACLPMNATARPPERREDELGPAVVASFRQDPEPAGIQNWLNQAKGDCELTAKLAPLRDVGRWTRNERVIAHEEGRYFEVVAMSVTATGREVRSWTQPLIAPCGTGLVAFLASRARGYLEVLLQARVEAGTPDTVELGPTVQCMPDNYLHLDPERRPAFLDHARTARGKDVKYDVVLSEEGGRFYQAENRYRIVEVADDVRFAATPPGFRWASLAQLSALIPHSGYLNVEARSLLACMRALC